MISGFKLRVTSDELKQHCIERSDYHKVRAEEKEEGLPDLEKSMAFLKKDGIANTSVSNMNKSSYNFNSESPVEDLKSDIRDHKKKSLIFAFYSKHLFEEDYTLEEGDLIRLDILKK